VTQRGEADVKAAIRAQGSRGSLKPTQALPIRRQRRGLRQCSGMSPDSPRCSKAPRSSISTVASWRAAP